MSRFKVSSLPLEDVIVDIAHEFAADYSEYCSLYEVELPPSLGDGKITGIDFNDGLGLIQYECEFKEDTEFEFTVDKVHPIKFLFCSEGVFEHKFSDESDWHTIREFKNGIVASSHHNGHVIRFSASTRTKLRSLELNRKKFQPKIACELDRVGKRLQFLFNDFFAEETFFHEGYYSMRMAEEFQNWDGYLDDSFLRKLHLEGMAYKLLVLQINQYNDDILSEGSKTILRQAELRQIREAVHLIESQLQNLPTISQMAGTVGLNPNKLQQGFQELYGKTVNEYIIDKKMETAKTLLQNSDMALSQVSSNVGYTSQSYFSKIFREKYGLLPSEFRRKFRR